MSYKNHLNIILGHTVKLSDEQPGALPVFFTGKEEMSLAGFQDIWHRRPVIVPARLTSMKTPQAKSGDYRFLIFYFRISSDTFPLEATQ